MSTENLPVLRVPSREEVRSRSLTRLMDFNEIPRIIIEDPKFTSGVSFKNFKNNFKDSYVDINARNAFNKTKSSSPVKARSMKQIEEENPEKESKNNLSIYKVANNSPKTPRSKVI